MKGKFLSNSKKPLRKGCPRRRLHISYLAEEGRRHAYSCVAFTPTFKYAVQNALESSQVMDLTKKSHF